MYVRVQTFPEIGNCFGEFSSSSLFKIGGSVLAILGGVD